MPRFEHPEDRDMRSATNSHPRNGIWPVQTTLGTNHECRPTNKYIDEYDYTAPELRNYALRRDGALHKSAWRQGDNLTSCELPNVYRPTDVVDDVDGYAVYVLVLRHPLDRETEDTIAIGSGLDTTTEQFEAMYSAKERLYVGQTMNPKRRLRDHYNGDGHAVTRHWKPIGLIDLIDGMSASQAKDVEQRVGVSLQQKYNKHDWFVYIS